MLTTEHISFMQKFLAEKKFLSQYEDGAFDAATQRAYAQYIATQPDGASYLPMPTNAASVHHSIKFPKQKKADEVVVEEKKEDEVPVVEEKKTDEVVVEEKKEEVKVEEKPAAPAEEKEKKTSRLWPRKSNDAKK